MVKCLMLSDLCLFLLEIVHPILTIKTKKQLEYLFS